MEHLKKTTALQTIVNPGKDLRALGRYIEDLIVAKSGPLSFNQAAKAMRISASDLHLLRKGARLFPNPILLQVIAEYASGDYVFMLKLAGYVPGNYSVTKMPDGSYVWAKSSPKSFNFKKVDDRVEQ